MHLQWNSLSWRLSCSKKSAVEGAITAATPCVIHSFVDFFENKDLWVILAFIFNERICVGKSKDLFISFVVNLLRTRLLKPLFLFINDHWKQLFYSFSSFDTIFRMSLCNDKFCLVILFFHYDHNDHLFFYNISFLRVSLNFYFIKNIF